MATPSGSRREEHAARPRRPPRRSGEGAGGGDLGARLLVAIPAIVVLYTLTIYGGLPFAVLVGVIGAICLHELYTMLERARPVKLVGYLALIALVIAARYGEQDEILLVLVAVLPVLFALLVVRPGRERATIAGSVTLLGIWWIGLAVAHAVLLRGLPHGDGILVDVLVATFVGDTGAYFAGRAFGRRPLAPTISPAKTWEGLGAGILTGVVAAWVAGFYQDWLSGGQALLLGLCVALAAPAGDLFESLIKRDVGIKDTGRAFGAHGGALDRVDAALFAIVVGYYVWRAML